MKKKRLRYYPYVRSKKQHRCGGRGKKHTIRLDRWQDEDKLTEYLEKHDIPHRVKRIKKAETYKTVKMKRTVVGKRPKWYYKYERVKGGLTRVPDHIIGYEDVVTWVEDGYKTRVGYKVIGYEVIWWHNKDIGLKYILGDECDG